MSKILDGEFRKSLYKDLMDAGYDKTEAQKIVGVKYYDGLKNEIKEEFTNMSNEIVNDKLDVNVEDFMKSINGIISELKKLKDVIQ